MGAREYSEFEKKNIDIVNSIFEGPAEFDRLSVFAEDAVWWNGLPHIGPTPGQTEHKGKEAIAKLMYGSQDPTKKDMGIDAYDMSTSRFGDVVVIADGENVVRQHTQYMTTKKGRDYCNVYCFVFKFNEDNQIVYLTEHWNTWYAHKFLMDQWAPPPAKPNG